LCVYASADYKLVFYEEKCIFVKNCCFILTKIEMLLVKSRVLYRQMYFLKYYEQTGSKCSIFGENDRYVLKAKNKMKAMWHIINKEVGNSIYYAYKIG
jgi:hypothetical protein